MDEITKSELRKKLGNISQLQELLFGEQTKKINHKLDLYNQKLSYLENKHQKAQLLIEERLEQLENKLSDQINIAINSLEKKIQYLNNHNREEHQKISQEINFVSQNTKENINYIQENIKIHNNNLKTEIIQSKKSLDEEIYLLKQQITEKIESGLSELSTGKVSRNDLAEVLFELCLKLREPDVNPSIEETKETSTDINFMPPQEK